MTTARGSSLSLISDALVAEGLSEDEINLTGDVQIWGDMDGFVVLRPFGKYTYCEHLWVNPKHRGTKESFKIVSGMFQYTKIKYGGGVILNSLKRKEYVGKYIERLFGITPYAEDDESYYYYINVGDRDEGLQPDSN